LRVCKSKWDIDHVVVGKVDQCSESGCFWLQCWDPVEKKVSANFSANAAGAHKPPVASMKDFIWVGSVPKRVDVPHRIPSTSLQNFWSDDWHVLLWRSMYLGQHVIWEGLWNLEDLDLSTLNL
jgi:hypothetical protein